MLAVSSTGLSLPPFIVLVYDYSKYGTRQYPKRFDHLKFITYPYMVSFTPRGFINDTMLIEYLEEAMEE
jgi:uncharacterized metal-binding protein